MKPIEQEEFLKFLKECKDSNDPVNAVVLTDKPTIDQVVSVIASSWVIHKCRTADKNKYSPGFMFSIQDLK